MIDKTNISLGLSIISIALSICSLIRIEPFVFTNDAILGASLAVISICTAVIVAYQIYNNATVEKRLKQMIGEEYRKISEEEKLKQKQITENELFFFKFTLVFSLSHSLKPESIYPIAVNALIDCNDNTKIQTETLCGILKSIHQKINVDNNPALEVYKKKEIEVLKRLTQSSDKAYELLVSLSRT